MLRGYSKFLDVLEKVEKAILAVTVGIMVIIIAYQVIMRYIFAHANSWSEELARYLFIYDVMIGAAIAIRRNSHLQIDILINLMKPKVRTILTIIATLAGMVFMVFLLSYSITLVQTGARTMSAGLGIPMSIPYSCMPVGIVLMLLTSIEVLFKNISALRGAGKSSIPMFFMLSCFVVIRQIYLAITFILLGIMISTQIQTQNRLMSDLSLQSTSDLSIMLKNLTDKRWQLSEEIDEAESNLIHSQDDYKDDSELMSRIDSELERLQLINGTIGAIGSGISITVQGNLLSSDLVLLINELWAASAEAVTINDFRVTPTSGISYIETLDKTYLTCDGNVLHEPITIKAIGNGPVLEKSLTMPGGIADNLSLYQIYLHIELQEELQLEALPTQPQLRYGKIPDKE